MRRMWSRAVVLGLVGIAAGSATGCADERPPINKVQADALAKSFFVGGDLRSRDDDPEFWTQGTVVDVGYGAAQDGVFTSTWAQPMMRIKWVIQEDLLIGRITYERIDNSDGKGVGAKTDDGVIAVAYKILSHFDIRRDYNPTTGEEMNIIVENTTDRVWNEREYMRVDWSKNLNTDAYDFDTLSLMGIYGGVSYEALSYYVNDPNHEDHPHFDADTGYFDVTNKAFAKPEIIDLSHLGWGIDGIPACDLENDFFQGTAPAGSCNPVEITIRQSFRRVVDRDYEPQDWDGRRFAAYGAFTVDRKGYARNYGMSDDKWHRFITRYNIWERSHFYTDPESMTGAIECYTPTTTPSGKSPHRDENKDGTEDECAAAGSGSRCDQFTQKCTLPYRERKAVPQLWYYTDKSNQEYFDGTDWAAHEWDVAMRAAVMSAKYGECKQVGEKDCSQYPMFSGQMDDNADAVWLAGEIDSCRRGKAYAGQDCMVLADQLGKEREMDAGVIELAKMDEMIVLCHSPVIDSDSQRCGARGLTVRMGDLRYHQVNAIATPQTPSPWGIYTDSEDPLTGEKVAASINVWTHVNDLFSQGLVDTMRYIKGELSTADVTNGTFVRDWVHANEIASSGGIMPSMTRQEVERRVSEFAGDARDAKAETAAKKVDVPTDPAWTEKLSQLRQEVKATRADARAPSAQRAIYEARRKAAVDSNLESKLVSLPLQQYAGVSSLPIASDVAMNAASPFRGANPTVQREYRRMKELAIAQRGACVLHESAAPLAIHGMADVLEEKFGKFNPKDSLDAQLARAETMRKWLAQRAHYSVIAHEMGHSVGMRHNFLSSADAWGYRPQYWQLRTNDGAVESTCTELTPDGETCVGPRYYDPVTENERKNLIWMFMQSSTMDYAGDQVQDMIGIGAYDFAAARMFYGEMVAVHADPSYNYKKARGKGMVDKVDSFGGIVGLGYTIGEKDIHYSALQNEYELLVKGTCKEIDPQKWQPAHWNEARDGKWHPLLDGQLVTVGGKTTRCKQQKIDYVPWQSLVVIDKNEWTKGIAAYDGNGRTRVPYPFATDGWADVGNLSVYRHDNGADPYELYNFWISQQEVQHVFDNYRRNRLSFSVRSAANRTLSRYSEKMRDGAKGIGLYRNFITNAAIQTGKNSDKEWTTYAKLPWLRDVILGSGMAFDHFTRQLARPEAGAHLSANNDPVLRSAEDTDLTGQPKLLIPNGASGYYKSVGIGGRLLENRLSDDKGEYDRDYTMNAGSYYDKMNTAYLMAESADNFISSSRTDFLDPRYRAVSLADLFPDGYRRWLANNLTGDDFLKGPRVAADDSGNPILDPENSLIAGECEGDGCRYPAMPIGWTSWWPATGAESCFPANGIGVCSRYGDASTKLDNPNAPKNVVVVDPQVGWEQQKFLIAWTAMYLPENQQQNWLDMMRIFERGSDNDPGFANRIEFHNPAGKVYIAKTFGKETIFGKTVQKGIAARVLEYANELLYQAYETEPGPDLDGDSSPDWYIPVLDPLTGQPKVRFDTGVQASAGCSSVDNSACTCASNRYCQNLSKYIEIPFLMRQALVTYGLWDIEQKGLYD